MSLPGEHRDLKQHNDSLRSQTRSSSPTLAGGKKPRNSNTQNGATEGEDNGNFSLWFGTTWTQLTPVSKIIVVAAGLTVLYFGAMILSGSKQT